LLEALIGGGLQLRYDNFKTYTAEEAFYARAGNCMSFTTLFVALAREAGVKARFQEVDVPPIWSAQGNTWRLNLHLNAVVDLPRAQQVVDFDMNSYSSERLRRVVSDDVALAHYYNNMGVHTLSEGGLELALAYFRAAIRLVPGASHLWANVGTLYRHTGNWEAAEAAYLRALELHSDPVAYSNLARLYSAHGETKLAAYYRERVDIFRASNPYYLFYLARQAYAANDYGATKRLLRKAINRNPEDHDFYRLQGLARVQSGDVNGARRSFKRAEQLAEGDARARYQQKLQLLASMR
jgi:Flp pilus assembly protein TadD